MKKDITFMGNEFRLREVRKSKNLTQQQIADVLGIKRQQYARYEMAVFEIPLHLLILLSDYYEISIDYLVGQSDQK